MKINDAYRAYKDNLSPETYAIFGEALFRYIKAIIASQFGNRFYYLEDAVGEAAHRIIKNLDSYDEKNGSFAVWVYAIASNVCIDMLRHSQTLKEQRLSGAEDKDVKAYSRESGHLLLGNLLSKLDLEDREFVLTHLHVEDKEEINRYLGISDEHRRKRYSRILQKLRTLVGGTTFTTE